MFYLIQEKTHPKSGLSAGQKPQTKEYRRKSTKMKNRTSNRTMKMIICLRMLTTMKTMNKGSIKKER